MATDKPVVIHTDNQEFRKLLDRCTVEGFKFSDNKEFIEVDAEVTYKDTRP